MRGVHGKPVHGRTVARNLRRWAPVLVAGCIALAAGSARADDIAVEQVGRIVFIRGGAADDGIVLSRPGEGILRVASSGIDTTVEGAQFFDIDVSGRASVYLQLGDGANAVFVDSLPTISRLVMLGGAGDDALTLRGFGLAGGVTFVGGNGDDSVELTPGASLRGELVATLGDGDDSVKVTDADVEREVVIDLGDGVSNQVLLDGATLGSALDVSGGEGADDVAFSGAFVRRAAQIDLGEGNDSLRIDGGTSFRSAFTFRGGLDDDSVFVDGASRFSRAAAFDLGDDDDTALIGDASFFGTLRVDCGDGDDAASLTSFTVARRMTVLCGTGEDRVTLDGNSPFSLGAQGGRIDGGIGRDFLFGSAAASGTVVRFEVTQ